MKMWEIFEKDGTWTQHEWARNSEGEAIPTISSRNNEAVCYCLFGAVVTCYSGHGHEKALAEAKIRDAIGRYSYIAWNDAPGRTQKEVYDLCKALDI